VNDFAHAIDDESAREIERRIRALQDATGDVVVIATVPTFKPYADIREYAVKMFENRGQGIGQRGKDNGALIVVAKNDRKVRIEVGYGLEGSLTDLVSRRIIAEDIAPRFREGQFAAGLNAGVDRIIDVVSKGEPLPAARSAKSTARASRQFDFGAFALLLFIIVPLVGAVLRSMLGRFMGSTVGAGIIGAGAWFFAGSLAIAIIAAIVGFIIMIFSGAAALASSRRGGVWFPGGWGGGGFGGGGGFSGGGGGFSGGGGSFGGGGSSGGW
jgi:uncharacterized protein